MVDLQNIQGINTEQLASTAGDWLVTLAAIVLGSVVFLFLAWYFYRELQFKIPIALHRVVGDGQIIESNDRLRINKKKGEIQTKKTKIKQTIPDPKFFLKTLKGWKLYGRWDGHQAIQWQQLKYNSPLSFEPDTYDVYTQMGYRIKNAAARHADQNFFDKYGNQIMMMTTVLVIAVVLIVLFDKVGELGPSIRAGLGEWAQAAKNVNVQQVS